MPTQIETLSKDEMKSILEKAIKHVRLHCWTCHYKFTTSHDMEIADIAARKLKCSYCGGMATVIAVRTQKPIPMTKGI